MSQVAVIVQARLSSRRLPKKVLMPLAGAPAIVRQFERLRRVQGADALVLATSDDASDDALVETCLAHDIRCVRGSLNDVLGRFQSAIGAGCDVVVRITGDCPLIDPELVSAHIARFVAEQPFAEYVSNAGERSYPDGLDVEVTSKKMIDAAAAEAHRSFDREHVTPWIRRRAKTIPIAQDVDLSALRLTLDEQTDYDCIAAIYDELYPVNPAFTSADIYRLLRRRPELIVTAGGVTAETICDRLAEVL